MPSLPPAPLLLLIAVTAALDGIDPIWQTADFSVSRVLRPPGAPVTRQDARALNWTRPGAVFVFVSDPGRGGLVGRLMHFVHADAARIGALSRPRSRVVSSGNVVQYAASSSYPGNPYLETPLPHSSAMAAAAPGSRVGARFEDREPEPSGDNPPKPLEGLNAADVLRPRDAFVAANSLFWRVGAACFVDPMASVASARFSRVRTTRFGTDRAEVSFKVGRDFAQLLVSMRDAHPVELLMERRASPRLTLLWPSLHSHQPMRTRPVTAFRTYVLGPAAAGPGSGDYKAMVDMASCADESLDPRFQSARAHVDALLFASSEPPAGGADDVYFFRLLAARLWMVAASGAYDALSSGSLSLERTLAVEADLLVLSEAACRMALGGDPRSFFLDAGSPLSGPGGARLRESVAEALAALRDAGPTPTADFLQRRTAALRAAFVVTRLAAHDALTRDARPWERTERPPATAVAAPTTPPVAVAARADPGAATYPAGAGGSPLPPGPAGAPRPGLEDLVARDALTPPSAEVAAHVLSALHHESLRETLTWNASARHAAFFAFGAVLGRSPALPGVRAEGRRAILTATSMCTDAQIARTEVDAQEAFARVFTKTAPFSVLDVYGPCAASARLDLADYAHRVNAMMSVGARPLLAAYLASAGGGSGGGAAAAEAALEDRGERLTARWRLPAHELLAAFAPEVFECRGDAALDGVVAVLPSGDDASYVLTRRRDSAGVVYGLDGVSVNSPLYLSFVKRGSCVPATGVVLPARLPRPAAHGECPYCGAVLLRYLPSGVLRHALYVADAELQEELVASVNSSVALFDPRRAEAAGASLLLFPNGTVVRVVAFEGRRVSVVSATYIAIAVVGLLLAVAVLAVIVRMIVNYVRDGRYVVLVNEDDYDAYDLERR